MATEPPLHGLRVLDCGGWVSAYAAHLLAEGGADVVRVVSPSGDTLAAEPPFFAATHVSIQETWYNLGKRAVELDPGTGPGRDSLARLLAGADILLEEWQPGQEPLTAAALTAAQPALVRVSLTAAGVDQPWLHSNDLVGNALSGGASVTGDAHTPPLTGYGNQAYHTAGMYGATCALAAYRAARLTGEPQHVDLSTHEALISCTEQVLMQSFFAGNWQPVAKRQGGLHWSRAYAVYPDREGNGMQVTAAMRFLEEILPWMVRDGVAGDLADAEKYPDLLAMVKDLDYVMDRMKAWTAVHQADDFFFASQARHLPFGPVYDIASAVNSPQLAAREYFSPRPVPSAGEQVLPGRLFRSDVDAPPLAGPAKVAITDIAWDGRPGVPRRPGPPSSRPLEGVRVLDFTHVLAGPFGTRVLADLGADVIKVSSESRVSAANSPMHPYYISWNRNKRSMMLNMRTERGRDIARALAAKSDAVIENFSAGVLKRWGLDRESMHAANPRLTVVNMGGMGQTGPWRDFVTFAPTIHALCGLTYLTNPPGEHLLGYGFSLTDHLSGLAGAIAVLEGVAHADRTGEGIEVDLSQFEVGLGLMAPALIDYFANGVNPEPVGNRHPFGSWAPHGIYRALGDDRWVAIAAKGDGQWQALCAAMGRSGAADDPRFATHEARLANHDALDAFIEGWTCGLDRYDVMAACQAAGVPAGAVQEAPDLRERDPSLAARAFFGEAEPSGGSGAHPIDRFPARFNGERPPTCRSAHQLGADTFEVMHEVLGLDDEAIAELVAEGVLS